MQFNKRTRMFIFDSCFGNMTGHWESYCRRLYNELVERGYAVTVYGEKKYQQKIVGEINFVPFFEHSAASEIKGIFDLNRQSALFLENFNKIDTSIFQDGDVFIFHSIFPQLLPSIIQWTKKILVSKKIIATLFFQFPPAESKEYVQSFKKNLYYKLKYLITRNEKNAEMDWLDNNLVRFYQFNSAELCQLVKEGTFQLYTSTDILAKNFSLMFGVPVFNLPMPGAYIKYDTNHEAAQLSRKIKIGYFGHSSFAKGGQFIRYLVDNVLDRCKAVEFILHINPNPETEPYLNHFKTHQYCDVRCYIGHLDQEKLKELIAEVDIVLLPYSPEKYHTTPSAIFTDAMPLKKVFVLPFNSWAYREAVKHGAKVCSFKKFDQYSILKALIESIENFYELREKSLDSAMSFVNEHNIKNYINIFEKKLIDGMSV